ncbi:zinc ribbon domain-containing protein [Microcoleus sp. Pol11C2]|uniref:zinc ribbon domain-containing protein n=1 Tax=Microcoleus sp. Pol11C2 TaxID=3055389 RepID=UPI002FD44E2C
MNYEKMAKARENFQGKISIKVVQENQVIVVENMAVNKLVKTHFPAKVISDCGWSKLTLLLKYKAERDGKTYLDIGRCFAPSSKSFHVGLNQVARLLLEVRSWTCCNCPTKHDRDVNSAIIIGDEGLGLLALGTSTTVHGRNVSSTFGRKCSI